MLAPLSLSRTHRICRVHWRMGTSALGASIVAAGRRRPRNPLSVDKRCASWVLVEKGESDMGPPLRLFPSLSCLCGPRSTMGSKLLLRRI